MTLKVYDIPDGLQTKMFQITISNVDLAGLILSDDDKSMFKGLELDKDISTKILGIAILAKAIEDKKEFQSRSAKNEALRIEEKLN